MVRGSVLYVLLAVFLAGDVNAECIYNGVTWTAGSVVPVTEPCLRCVCARASLLCQLRVCPEVPDPPPSRCTIVHRRNRCCPELHCPNDDPGNQNRIEARLEPDFPEIPYNQSMVGNGCVQGGTVYGSGSAMHTSSHCSYCYCIAGRQRCVRPRCVLPAPGCRPIYRPHACCPTSYKCLPSANINNNTDLEYEQHHEQDIEHDPDACLVQGVVVTAGAAVHPPSPAASPCDKCWCVRGIVQCTRLRCAPALPGCTPMVPRGACCPTSYNCSGIIEVQPLLNYEKPPDVSPEYAKLRKEVHHLITNTQHNTKEDSFSSTDTKYPHYIVPESQYQPLDIKTPQKTSTPYYFTSTTQSGLPTIRQNIATTKHLPLNENLNPENSAKYSRISLTTTRVGETEKLAKLTTEAVSKAGVVLSPVYKRDENVYKNSNYIDTDEFNNDLYSDGRNNRRIDDQTDPSTTETTTEYTSIFTTDVTTDTFTLETTTYITTTDTELNKTFLTDYTTDKIDNETTLKPSVKSETVVKLIGNNSECIDGPIIDEEHDNEVQSDATIDEVTTSTTTLETTSVATTIDNLEISSETDAMNLSATTVPFKKIPDDIEAVNKKDEDYEYDYNLQPNLEIIPFVAADAVVDGDGVAGITAFPPHQDSLREADDPLYPAYNLNLFSPPQETEGGFVPRDPPLLDSFYPGSGVVGAGGDMTQERGDSCLVFGVEVAHGALAAPGPACHRCLCLFGAVVCQPPGCNERLEAPSLLLDRADVTESQDATDPFRDVIRTEPAPDLHELIGDLPLHQTPTVPTLTTNSHSQEDKKNSGSDSFYDALFELLGGDENNRTTSSTTTTTHAQTTSPTKYKTTNTPWSLAAATTHSNIIEDLGPTPGGSSVGLLKLAGCNIYGRMYRVGKIIAELSGPCLQCRCTDTGVQCTSLPC